MAVFGKKIGKKTILETVNRIVVNFHYCSNKV